MMGSGYKTLRLRNLGTFFQHPGFGCPFDFWKVPLPTPKYTWTVHSVDLDTVVAFLLQLELRILVLKYRRILTLKMHILGCL